MLPLSFRFEDADQLKRPRGFQTPWRSFGNTLVTQICDGDYQVTVRGSGRQFQLQAGMGFLIPPGCRHQVATLGERDATAYFTHLHCRVYELEGLFRVLREPVIFPRAEAKRIGDCIRRMIKAKMTGVQLRTSTLVAVQLAQIVDIAVRHSPDIETAWNNPQRERLMPVLRFIQDHLAEPLQRRDLAHCAGLSIPHLHTVFVEAFGHAPMEVLRRERMQHASQLLHWSDLSIAEVAVRCGFEDQYYFSRAFKRWEGVPPSVYRRRVRDE